MEIKDYYLLAKDKLSDYRYHHSCMVADAAESLALKYNQDPIKAKTAGILHDITKELSLDEQLQLIYDNGIMLDSVTANNHKILHALSGYTYCKCILCIKDEDILNAVRFHTTARASMSMLEKIIYVSDYISTDRTYPDVEVMRERSAISLESGMKYALSYVINKLVSQGQTVHPDAINAYNELIMKGF